MDLNRPEGSPCLKVSESRLIRTMKTILLTAHIMLLSLISWTSADVKCKMTTTDNDEHILYSCVQATFDDINNIPNKAEWIQFTVSKLSHLPEKAFTGFTLRGLSFYNCEIGHIAPSAFDGLKNLQSLTFYGSNIHVLKASWFKDMSSLTHLFLDQNDLVYIEPNVFSLVPNLEYLNIEDNNLNCLTRHNLLPLRKLKHVRIGKNPWLCTCYTDLVEWMKNRQITYGVQNMTTTKLECMVADGAHPGDLKTEFDTIHDNSSVSTTEYLFVSLTGNVLCVGNNISVLSRIPENVKSIKFLNSDIVEIPRVAFFRFGNNLKSLDFSNCSISNIHPEAFAGLSKLERLILFNNSFSIVRAEWFRDLHRLKHLALDSNGIQHVQSSVFPLLHNLETLSLKKNYIGCFPMRAFASMKHLKNMNIANNTWICRCFKDFRQWMNQSETEYHGLPTQCTDKKTHMNDGQYVSEYRNVTFEQDLETEEAKIIDDNARLTLGGTLRNIEPFGGSLIEVTPYENHSATVENEEAYHKQNKEQANYEYYRLRAEQEHEPYVHVIRAKYAGFERSVAPDIPSGNINFYIHRSRPAQTNKNNPVKSSSVSPVLSNIKKSYVSVGGTIWDILSISLEAETITFERSIIRRIIGQIFSQRVTLRVLKFLNCGVREIDPQAFEGLVNLHTLILEDNEINVVRAAWFEGIPNLHRLGLSRNSITRIENGVYQLLPNLKSFWISNNQLNCIGIDGLSYLKELNSMAVGNNPWSCLCQIKLNQWLIENKIQYDRDIFDKRAEWYCIEEHQGPKITNDNQQNKNSIDDRRVDSDVKAEESVIIQDTEVSQNPKKMQKNEHAMENPKNIQIKNNDTNLNVTTSEVPPTVPIPTTVESEHPRNQCEFYVINQNAEGRWQCNGGNISALETIPSSAEGIQFTDSNISVIPANAFVRFSNLTRLLFYNCSIHDIDPLAFATLNRLEWLIFLNNSIPTIRSSWFHDLVNVTLLGLVRNGISEVEPNVFEYLPSLERLSIQDNNIRCIYTKSLLSLKNLQRVTMHDNPWKWRCREELTQFFEARNISYIKSENYAGQLVFADLLTDDDDSG